MKPDWAACFTADWHLDQTRNLDDTAKCVDFVIAETIRRRDLLGPDVPFFFSHLGDGYRTFRPSPAEADVMHRTRTLRERGIESEILCANHDRAESEEFGDQVHAFVDMRNLGGAMDVIESPTIKPIMSKGRAIAYRLIIPHIRKADLQRSGLSYPEFFKKTLDGLIASCPKGSRMIALSHFFVKEAKVGPNDHVVGDDRHVPVAYLADPRLMAFLLGDIHKAQRLAAKPFVGYCGSIDRVDFGEADDVKGFIYLEAYGDEVKIEFIPTPARKFVAIVADLVGVKAPGEKFFGVPEQASEIQPWLESEIANYDVKDAIVKVSIQCAPNQKSQIDDRRLIEVLAGLGAHRVRSVSFDVATAENRRAPEITESLSPVVALEKWAESQKYPDMTKQMIVLAGKKLIGAAQ